MNLKNKKPKFNKILKKKRKKKKTYPEYEKYSTLFHSKAEVEGDFYKNTKSFLLEKNGLVFSQKIKKREKPVAFYKAAALASGKKKKEKKGKKGR
ncbi:MAG: hypothetical protein CM1200mP13_12070 [Candidatus Pelagibacterales bacterium]|nr:MAG: hypothetical protein CM1200mP13_12070 [Pelagibacterales bacterium]